MFTLLFYLIGVVGLMLLLMDLIKLGRTGQFEASKKRTYLIAIVVFALLWSHYKPADSGPTPDNQRPVLTKIVKLFKWTWWAFLNAEDPPAEDQPDAQTVQSLPQAAPLSTEQRGEIDRQGNVVINHARGW